ncbi:MAG: ABC transporter substrate-binding protein [Dehalococcoidia bacterium]
MTDEFNYWQRKIRRRTIIRGSGLAAAGIGAAALVGCGDDDDDDDSGGNPTIPATVPGGATASAEKPKTGGTFRIHMGGSPRSLDPHFDTFPYNTAVTDLTNEALLKWSPDFSKIETELASALPEQPDPNTFTFKLKPGIKFQDVEPANGRAFTSEDVKYSIERQATDEAGKFQHAYYFKGKLDSITTPDDTTVIIKTKDAYAPFMSYIASPWTVMIDKMTVDKYGDLTEHAVGTGPFIFKEWQKDVKIDLVKNPNYRDSELPYLDAISYIIAIDPDTAATLYINRQVDAGVFGQSQLDRLKEARESDSEYRAVPSQFWKQMRMMPTTKDKPYKAPFDNIKVREAIVRAVDPQQVLDLVYSKDGVLTHGPILPIYPLWALKDEIAGFDLKKAKDLMSAAGDPKVEGPMIWATGSPQADQIGEVLKEQLAKIGVDITLQPMELAAYYNQTYAYDYTFSHHTPLNNPDPDENLSAYFGRNSTYFKHYNEDVFNLIDQQAKELDTPKRQAIVKDVQEKIVNEFAVKFMYTTNNHIFVDKKIKGWFFPTDLYDGRKATAWLDA